MKKFIYIVIYSLRLGVTAGISFYLGKKVSAITLPIPEVIGGLWSVISGILVLKRGSFESLQLGAARILGTLIGSLVSGLFLLIFKDILWVLPVVIFLVALLCFLFRLGQFYIPGCIAASVVLIVWQLGTKTHPWLFSLSRFVESAIGVLVAIFVIHIPPFERGLRFKS